VPLAAALQGIQQVKDGPMSNTTMTNQAASAIRVSYRGAGVGQGHSGAGQQHWVLGYATPPHDGGHA
jgi:hypothetical protein